MSNSTDFWQIAVYATNTADVKEADYKISNNDNSNTGPSYEFYPESLADYCFISHEYLLLDSAYNHEAFKEDQYIQDNKIESVLCFPVIDDSEVIAVIYIENKDNIAKFNLEKYELARLLSTQATMETYARLNKLKKQYKQ
jgi:GAF domain-containing protein